MLCQVATAVHVPMVHADTAGIAPATVAHCADQGPLHAGEHSGTPSRDHYPRHPVHFGSCGCGLCQCPCAQAPALNSAFPVTSATRHLPVTLPYRLPDVAQLASAFFRPPI
jgi:hypothetical protein